MQMTNSITALHCFSLSLVTLFSGTIGVCTPEKFYATSTCTREVWTPPATREILPLWPKLSRQAQTKAGMHHTILGGAHTHTHTHTHTTPHLPPSLPLSSLSLPPPFLHSPYSSSSSLPSPPLPSSPPACWSSNTTYSYIQTPTGHCRGWGGAGGGDRAGDFHPPQCARPDGRAAVNTPACKVRRELVGMSCEMLLLKTLRVSMFV